MDGNVSYGNACVYERKLLSIKICCILNSFMNVNVYIFVNLDSRLSGLFTQVPTSPDNRDQVSTVLNWQGHALIPFYLS